MISVHERAEECTVKLRTTFVNPSMVLAYNDLTSKQKNFGTPDSSVVSVIMQNYAFMSELGGNDTNQMHAAKSEHHHGLNKTPHCSRSAVEHCTGKQTHRVQIKILSQMHQYFLHKIAVTCTAVTHFHLCL